MSSKNILERLNRFVIGTMRGRRMVKKIRLSESMYEQYKEEMRNMGCDVSGKIYFMGIEVVKCELPTVARINDERFVLL